MNELTRVRTLRGGPLDGRVANVDEPTACLRYSAPGVYGEIALHYHADDEDAIGATTHHLCVVEFGPRVFVTCGVEPWDDQDRWEYVGDYEEAVAEAHRRKEAR